ncbi:chromosomal replication initiator protein DnaA [Haliangium ochraceum]|uniref:Chromosomal replication initiator protein DnaA n=1 Tax=Haliangium ochraceum (strain DSM 14365 / JCM 11303 / SMP-2) TaxID=502025 RepID=D0LFK9_HALO1|nr:chromosomal replication initiator protein DnaA [Haliangium ochraceum]ACY12643.1 chromosomal replication initiator protein DnaA [Haliangium ochraceum DSM 14365]
MTDPWAEALRSLSSKLSPQNYEMWLRPIRCRDYRDEVLVLEAPNSYVRLWFESNYLAIVLDEIKEQTGISYRVEFLPEPEDGAAAQPEADDVPGTDDVPAVLLGGAAASASACAQGAAPITDISASRSARPRAASGQRAGASAGGLRVVEAPPEPVPPPPLNPRYTFDSFVAGPSNQLALAASQAAASSHPPKYNPVFICGGVGLGKTHLLHSIGHSLHGLRPDARILYLSGERFMNEYILAIRSNRMHEFRRRYREGCDLLLIDDVQFLAGKDGTQDEFFHTFNALHDSQRQIVLTADRKPHEISDIADRLRSRFQWGLLADIEPPELEMRMAILRQKAEAEHIELPDDVVLYIATAIRANVRELEGALIRLSAYASLSRKPITLAFARETLEGSLTRKREHLTTEMVIKTVANYYGLKVSDIKSARRHKAIAGPRAVAMYLARAHTKDSYPDLGRAFGGKHHTTVISAVEKITAKREEDLGLSGEIQAIESVLLRS